MNTFLLYFKKVFVRIANITRLNKVLRYISDKYEKKQNPINTNKNMPVKTGWSILVITDGKSKESLDIFIKSAEKELKNSPYEIIVVGPTKLDLSYFSKKIPIIHTPYKELGLWGVPGGISRKKNFGAQFAKYDKMVISHDYVVFTPGWKKGFDDVDFTAGTNVVLNKDGKRHRDWITITIDPPFIRYNFVPYDKSHNEQQYLNGTYFFIKRDFFLDNPLDEKLRWGEGEDVYWSIEIRKKIKFTMNTKSTVSYSKLKPDDEWKMIKL